MDDDETATFSLWRHRTYQSGFADTGGNSALRRATRQNPRIHPCPTCKRPDMLTAADVRRGYQCDGCVNAEEGCY